MFGYNIHKQIVIFITSSNKFTSAKDVHIYGLQFFIYMYTCGGNTETRLAYEDKAPGSRSHLLIQPYLDSHRSQPLTLTLKATPGIRFA